MPIRLLYIIFDFNKFNKHGWITITLTHLIYPIEIFIKNEFSVIIH